MSEISPEKEKSELDALVSDWEARRPILIEILTSMKERGVHRESIGAGGFTFVFVLEGSGSMLVITDSEGKEALIRVPEVALDPAPNSDLFHAILAIVRLRFLLRQRGVSSLIAPGGYSVVADDEGGLKVSFPDGDVLIEEDGRFVPRDVDSFKVYEVVERLSEAAEASHEA